MALSQYQIEIIKTVASTGSGTDELFKAIEKHQLRNLTNEKKAWLLAERAYYLIQQKRMKDVTKISLEKMIKKKMQGGQFNLYQFANTAFPFSNED